MIHEFWLCPFIKFVLAHRLVSQCYKKWFCLHQAVSVKKTTRKLPYIYIYILYIIYYIYNFYWLCIYIQYIIFLNTPSSQATQSSKVQYIYFHFLGSGRIARFDLFCAVIPLNQVRIHANAQIQTSLQHSCIEIGEGTPGTVWTDAPRLLSK